MHELSLAMSIADIALERAGDQRVERVVLEVGRLAAVVPDALRFCFEAVTKDTALAGAVLDIVDVPGKARCRACGAETELDGPGQPCGCGSLDLEWIAGLNLNVRALEVA